jgi:integrase
MRDMLETNPCYKLPRPAKEVKRAHVINDDDLATIWHAATLEGYPFGTIVKLLMLTLQRRAEVAGMRRSELDFKNNVWILPPHRTKNGHEHRVPMTPRFKAIIKTIPFNKDSDLLFPNITNPDKPFQSFGNAKANLDITAGITGWTLHDLRRTGDTRLAGYLVPKEDREKLMNHLSGMFKGVGGIYDRNKYEKQKANALRVWAAHLKRSTKAHKPALKPRPDHWALTIKRPLAARLATRAYRKKRRAAAKAA